MDLARLLPGWAWLILGALAFGFVVDVLLGKMLPHWLSFPIAFGAAVVLAIWLGYAAVLS